MVYGRVNKIIPFSSVDGPGNRTAIFLQGCNFDCLYCHNPETINVCINCGQCVPSCQIGALSFEENKVVWNKEKCVACDKCIKSCGSCSSPKTRLMTAEQVISEIEPYRTFISGITVSGGECTLQKKFLVELFTLARSKGLSCLIDSNGSNSFREMEDLLELSDGVMLDVKAWDEEEHIRLTGKRNDVVIDNLEYLLEKGKLHEVRTVIVPEILNNELTVQKVSHILNRYKSSAAYKLIKYRPLGVRLNKLKSQAPSEEYMHSLTQMSSIMKSLNVLII